MSVFPLQSNTPSGGYLAEGNRKHKVQSEIPVRFLKARLWVDCGLARLRVRKRTFA